eukprot:scaffold174696_cov15-Tisochrysis_lutea.AAC.1
MQSLLIDDVNADQRIALLGAMQSLFEASMYTFVFLWTPALSPNGEKLPHGVVFSCFMTACMAGSALTGLLIRKADRTNAMAGKLLSCFMAPRMAGSMLPSPLICKVGLWGKWVG